jgi:8-oxo-dGTP pyrophosphatase MutT (NUDIX family)
MASALLAELRAYRAADPTEDQHQRAIVAHLVHAKAPLNRARFKPGHVTASLFIVDPKTRRILLHHHRRLDRWLQMGGHLDAKETPVMAALREGREESGLGNLALLVDGIFDLDVHLIPAHGDDPAHFHYDIRYLASTATPAAISASVESKDLAWFSLDDARTLMNEEASTRALAKIAKCVSGTK